jgi:hypothetical protein
MDIFLSAIAMVAIGAGWYGPLFGKKWMHLLGMTKESMKAMAMKPVKAMALGFVSALVTSAVFAYIIQAFSVAVAIQGVAVALTAAVWVWIGFFGPATLSPVLWEGKPWKLFFINGGYYAVSLIVSAVILALV